MKTFFLPPGYRVELVASEPMIQDPVLIDWDPRRPPVGRSRCPATCRTSPATTEREPIGRISVLEDTNDDGQMDKRTVFLDGLVLPRALKVLDRGVLVGEPPNLWLAARHQRRPASADTKELVTDTLRPARRQRRAQRQQPALGARQLDAHVRGRHLPAAEERHVRGRARRSRAASGARRRTTPAASTATRTSRRCTSTSCRRRTSRATRTCCGRAAATNRSRGDENELNAVWPVRPTPGVNRGYQAGVLRADGTLAPLHRRAARRRSIAAIGCRRSSTATSSSPSRPAISSAGSSSSDDGTKLRGTEGVRRTPSSSPRPTSGSGPSICRHAPDGTLYVVDMYRGIIQHRGYITEYLRDQILSRKLEQPIGHGRIYRVVHETTRRGPTPALSQASPAQLVETLVASRTAGGATRRSGCWSSAATRRSCPALEAAGARPRPTRARGCTRCGRSTGWTASTPAGDRGARRSVARRARRRRSGCRSDGWPNPRHPASGRRAQARDDPDWAVRQQLAAIARRAAGGRARDRARSAARAARRRPDHRRRGAQRSARQRSAVLLGLLMQSRRGNAAAERGDHDARGHDRARRPGWSRAGSCSRSLAQSRAAGMAAVGAACGAPRRRCSARRWPGGRGGRGAAAAEARAPVLQRQPARAAVPGSAPAFPRAAGRTPDSGRR